MPGARRAGDLRAALAAITALRRRLAAGDGEAGEDLLAGLGHRQALVREAAARAVREAAATLGGAWPGRGGPAQAVDALLAAIVAAGAAPPGSDPGCRIRREAVGALGILRPQPGRVEAVLHRLAATVQLESVGGAMEDTAVMLRADAALVMAALGCDCLPDLGLLLFSGLPDPLTHVDWTAPVREAAARALGALGDPAGVALLAVRLRETREAGEVLAACVDALCTLGHPRAVEWIAPLLEGADPVAAVAAATALCALQPDLAATALPARAAVAPATLAEALVLALAAARSSLTVPALRRLAQDGRTAVRRAAAAGLAQLGAENP